jgi:hypothetical protein
VQVLPGGRLLAAADEVGSVSMSDLRMLGTPKKHLLWQVGRCDAGGSHRQRRSKPASSCMVASWHLLL